MSIQATGQPRSVEDQQTELREITAEQFRDLGANQVAYVRAGMCDGRKTFVLFNANGTAIGRAASRDVVFEAADEFELTVVAIH